MSDSLRDLLGSPLDDEPEGRGGVTAAVVMVGLVIAVGIAWVAMAGGDDRASPDAASGSSPSAPIVTTTMPPQLEPVDGEEQLLYHPTVLPAGLELCAAALGRPTTGDEYCDPDDSNRWIEVATPPSPVSGESIEGRPGFVLVGAAEPFAVGVPDVGLLVTGAGLELDQLVEVTASIPLADAMAWDTSGEDPIAGDIDDEFFSRLLGAAVGDLDVRRTPTQIDVYGPDLILSTSLPGDDAADDVRQMAAGLIRPVSISDERMLVVGDRPFHGSIAVWSQRGRFWSVRSDRDRDVLADQLAEVEAMIEVLG